MPLLDGQAEYAGGSAGLFMHGDQGS